MADDGVGQVHGAEQIVRQPAAITAGTVGVNCAVCHAQPATVDEENGPPVAVDGLVVAEYHIGQDVNRTPVVHQATTVVGPIVADLGATDHTGAGVFVEYPTAPTTACVADDLSSDDGDIRIVQVEAATIAGGTIAGNGGAIQLNLGVTATQIQASASLAGLIAAEDAGRAG